MYLQAHFLERITQIEAYLKLCFNTGGHGAVETSHPKRLHPSSSIFFVFLVMQSRSLSVARLAVAADSRALFLCSLCNTHAKLPFAALCHNFLPVPVCVRRCPR